MPGSRRTAPIALVLTFVAVSVLFRGSGAEPRIDDHLQAQVRPSATGHYEVEAIEQVISRATPRDASGIVMVDYNGTPQYNPITIAQYGLGYYGRWLDTRSPGDKRQYLALADWLVANQQPSGAWLYQFPYAGMPVPWVSAMAEGQGISLLVRTYESTHDSKYREAADLALGTYLRVQGDTGVAVRVDGYVYYEEYMPPYSPHTLNGFIFALIGAWDYAEAFDDRRARSIFDAGLITLTANLGKWDTSEWSRYNLANSGYTATLYYHMLHVAQLRVLFELSGNDVFQAYADRWAAFAESIPAYVERTCALGVDCP
jgi:heparosan-N-sulfate-glucuronate 5-epimerase